MAHTRGLYKRPIIALLDTGTSLLVEIENLRLYHFTFNLLKTNGSRMPKPIPNKSVLYLKLAGWSKNICATNPLEGTWHLEVELACYKEPLKKQWKLCVGAKCHCSSMAATARTRQVEQSQKILEGPRMKN